MFKVVKDKQELFIVEKVVELALLILNTLECKVYRRRGGSNDVFWQAKGCKRHKPDTIREEAKSGLACFHCQASFPRPAKSMQGDQSDFLIFQQAD